MSIAIPEGLGRDRFGVLHDTEPGALKRGHACYGKLDKPAYRCGCQPLIHRFRCAACRRKVGWCYGGASEYAWENECCNGCVVTVWRSAQRLRISVDEIGARIDANDGLRRALYDRLREIFAAVEVPHVGGAS